MSKLKVTSSNNLLKLYPKLVKNEWDFSKNKLSPSEVVAGTGKKAWWICPEKNHSYEAIIANRTNNNSGCPYCTGVKVGKDNNLKFVRPDIAKEWDYKKNKKNPDEIIATTNTKYWFICPEKKHSYFSRPLTRVTKNTGCPYCSGHKVGKDNNLKFLYPDVAKDWDFEKNDKKPSEVYPYGRNHKYWFTCSKGHSYKTAIHLRIRGCKFCSGRFPSETSNLTQVEFFKEWDYQQNKNIDPTKIAKKSGIEYWWKCKEGHSWKQSPAYREMLGRNCPFCANRRVDETNSLQKLYPEIAKEWDTKKNKKKASDVVYGSHYLAHWICTEKHSYSTRVHLRTVRNQGCPYCSGKKVSKTNNLKFLFPEIAKEWDTKKNKKKAQEVTSQTHTKYWWICSAGHSYKTSVISRTPSIKGKTKGTGCPFCTLTPRSKDEIYILFELKNFFNISENDHKIKLSRVNDVDIKLKNEKIVIEYDGAYWHKDKAEKDKRKTKELQKAGWTVIRVREKPLKILSRKYNVTANSQDYKNNTNKVLKKISGLGYQVNGLNKYLARKSLINKDEADKYMKKLLKEKASIS